MTIRRPTPPCLALAALILLALAGCATTPQITLTLGRHPVYIEPAPGSAVAAQAAPPSTSPQQAVTRRAFGVDNFIVYNQGGFHYRLADQLHHQSYLGLGFMRLAGGRAPSWGQVQHEAAGGYDFRRYDDMYAALTDKAAAELMPTVQSYAAWDQDECHPERDGPMFPCDAQSYLAFLKAVVARYDGDHPDYGCTQPSPDCYQHGDGQYPTWYPASRPAIKSWQIENEADLKPYWADTPQRYAELLKLAYQAIKEVCPECRVVMAGQSGQGSRERTYSLSPFYRAAIQAMDARWFDVVDNHLFKRAGDYNVYRGRRDDYLAILAAKGFCLPEFWVTETDTFSGTPSRALGYQSEEVQADELVKRYAYLFASGVRKVCWTKVMEQAGFNGRPCDFFNFTDLINNPLSPEDCSDPAHPQGFGGRSKKLAYYSLKLLIDKLTGADWGDIRIVQERDNVYVYEFRAGGRPLYVAWWDGLRDGGGAGKTVTIDMPDMPQEVQVTEAVPNAPSGADLTDAGYPLFFNSQPARLH